MSSPATTRISFRPTDAAMKDKRQTNLTSVGKTKQDNNKKEPLSFVNMNTTIKTTKDNATDECCNPTTPCLLC